MAQRQQATQRKPTEQRQSEIVEAALQILASEGSRKLTAERIASELGISGGAIFRHFPSMDAISRAIVDRMEEVLFNGFPPEHDDPITRLGRFFEQRVTAVRSNPAISMLLLNSNMIQSSDPALQKRILGFKTRSREFVRTCLRDARKAGILKKTVLPEEGAILVLGAIYALAHAPTRVNGNAGDKKIHYRIWSILESLLQNRNKE
jgi:AcrR family transcriptional regulator